MNVRPGDWLFVIADGVMVAMTHEAYAEGYAYAQRIPPDIWDMARAKGRGIGDMIKLALDTLAREGIVRREECVPEGAEHMRWPVYAIVPPVSQKAQRRPVLELVESVPP